MHNAESNLGICRVTDSCVHCCAQTMRSSQGSPPVLGQHSWTRSTTSLLVIAAASCLRGSEALQQHTRHLTARGGFGAGRAGVNIQVSCAVNMAKAAFTPLCDGSMLNISSTLPSYAWQDPNDQHLSSSKVYKCWSQHGQACCPPADCLHTVACSPCKMTKQHVCRSRWQSCHWRWSPRSHWWPWWPRLWRRQHCCSGHCHRCCHCHFPAAPPPVLTLQGPQAQQAAGQWWRASAQSKAQQETQ